MKVAVNIDKCVGCRICELACSFQHERVFGMDQARIRVSKLEDRGVDMPLVCRQCSNHPCITACPIQVLGVDEDTGAVVLTGTCTGCGMCVAACPFGAANLHPQQGTVLICDMCGGSPNCVRECPTGALSVKEGDRVGEINLGAARKRQRLAERAAEGKLRDWGLSK